MWRQQLNLFLRLFFDFEVCLVLFVQMQKGKDYKKKVKDEGATNSYASVKKKVQNVTLLYYFRLEGTICQPKLK